MSQYMPNTAIASEPATNASGKDAQPGISEERSAKAAMRPTWGSFPLRWPATTANIAAVITKAPAVATAVSAVAAPPAGAAFAM